MEMKFLNRIVACTIIALSIATIISKGIESNADTNNGWNNDGKNWYYYQDGVMKTGWYCANSEWYLLRNDGTMETGWITEGGKWYYLQSDGSMKIGWIKSNGNWYYLNIDGTMKIGWVQDNEKWYYLSDSGEMITNSTINGYKLDENGVWNQEAKVNNDVENSNDIINAQNLIKKADLTYINNNKNGNNLVYDKVSNETSKKFGINEDTYAFAFENEEQVDKYYFVGKVSGNVYKTGGNGLFAAYLLKDEKLAQRFKGPHYLEKSEANYIGYLGNGELKQQ